MTQLQKQKWINPIQDGCRRYGLSFLVGIVVTFLVLGAWQQLFLEELRSTASNVVLFSGVLVAWMLALTVYLGQRLAQYSRQVTAIKQQLHAEKAQWRQAVAPLHIREPLPVLYGDTGGLWGWNVLVDDVSGSRCWKDMLGRVEQANSTSPGAWDERMDSYAVGWGKQVIQNRIVRETPFHNAEHQIQRNDSSYNEMVDRKQLWLEVPHVHSLTRSSTGSNYHGVSMSVTGAAWGLPSSGNTAELGDHIVVLEYPDPAELALKLSQERLQLALEASGDGLWDWDIKTGQIYHSPRYLEILGYGAGELAVDLQTWEQSIHPDDKTRVLECLDTHLKDSLVKYTLDYRVRCSSGEWKWITDYGKVVAHDPEGKPLRMIGAYKDISDRKHKEIALREAMEAAEAANLAKSAFLANMSHELRTPLNVILGFTQVMGHDPSLTPAQKEDLQTIRRSGDHLLSLINDVLDLSKIEAGHCVIEEAGFDLISLLHTLRTMMTERARAKHLHLDFDIAPDVPQFVIADEQKLCQVLLNLLSNAIKFTHKGGITLRVTNQGPAERTCFPPSPNTGLVQNFPLHTSIYLRFGVTDTGVGVAAQEQSTIFDAFVQADAGRKSISGAGLGLTISRKLLELMKGTISVQSAPGVGSTFTITVPMCPSSSVHDHPDQHDRSIIGLVEDQPNPRILVVDDQPENRLVLVRLLGQLGLDVREATNGYDAIRIWQEWRPALTWMDIRMPGLDGYEATQQIRAMEQGPASIIIALTAQASQSDRALALSAGCNDYISKPFREETLFLKLKEYLGLEYRYAEPDAPSLSLESISMVEDQPLHVDPLLLAHLSSECLRSIEDAALCGNDRAIVGVASQFPPELSCFSTQLIDLAEQFQFERILELIDASPAN